MLERLKPVEHQETALVTDQPGQRPSLLGGIDKALAGMAEVAQRLLEEELGGGVSLLVVSLAVEGVDEDPAGTAIVVVAHPSEPFRHDPRLTRSAFGVEHEDTGAFVPGLVEGVQLGLAAGEAFAVGAQDLQAVGFRGGGRRVGHWRFGAVRSWVWQLSTWQLSTL
jgi:hypothetical protein